MKKLAPLSIAIAAGIFVSAAMPPMQHADFGSIERLRLYSPEMQDTMIVDMWLPEGYNPLGEKRYPVIYMHDGQNLYDANTTWNRQAWEIDSVMGRLAQENSELQAIVVGIHSKDATRLGDLMPQKAVAGKPLEGLLKSMNATGIPIKGDAYAAFMTRTLKPAIDALYLTLPEKEHTAVMGSSMGGLMSIYAICEYPEVFGTALCLSTHWIGSPGVEKEFESGMTDYIISHLPSPSDHKLYFDHGTETLDAGYGDAEKRVLKAIGDHGYGPERLKNLVAEGAAHDERSWASRVAVPIRFFLEK